MKAGVTGHRPSKLGGEYENKGPYSDYIRKQLQEVIDDLKPESMWSGLALGVDTIWAELAVENKIRLFAVVPFEGQELKWPTKAQEHYHYLLNYARNTGFVFYTASPGYEAWKMQFRNEFLVDKVDKLVAVYNGDKFGGTFNCIEYAKKVQRDIIYLRTHEDSN